MNVYFCHLNGEDDYGCYVAADTIGKAKALFAKWDGREDFTEYRGYVVRKGVDVFAGVYDDNCAELERLGLGNDFDAEEWVRRNENETD